MATRYKVVAWAFDTEGFSRALKNLFERDDLKVVSGVIGVDETTLYNWWAGSYRNSGEFGHPRMSNFIACCNHCDLDPRDYFVLTDTE